MTNSPAFDVTSEDFKPVLEAFTTLLQRINEFSNGQFSAAQEAQAVTESADLSAAGVEVPAVVVAEDATPQQVS